MSRTPNIDQLLQELREKGGGSRQSTLRVLSGKVDRHGAPFRRESLQFEDEAEGLRTVDVVETRTCAFGHTIDDKTRVAGICQICGEVLCSSPGCMSQCVRCGAVVCRRHGRTYGEVTYCRSCRWVHFWRLFWRLG